MALKGLQRLYRYSRIAQHRRKRFVDWRWRAIVFLLVLVLFAYVVWYAQSTYFLVVGDVPNKAPFLLSDRLIEWFAWGFFAGFFAFVVLAEGEFLIGLRRVSRELEREMGGFERTVTELERGVERAAMPQTRARPAARQKGRRR